MSENVRNVTPATFPATGDPDLDKLLREIDRLLQNTEIDRALEVIRRSKRSSPWITNAAGVCQLRRGNLESALTTFRSLVLDGIHVREGIPPLFKLNLACALLASNNLDGFLAILHETPASDHPLAVDFHRAYHDWKQERTRWEKLWLLFGKTPDRPFELAGPLGAVW